MRRLLKEPLVHFLLLGAAFFAAYSFVSARAQPAGEAIVVPAGKVEHLAALFVRTWQRPPTRAELERLVNDFVREEAAYRQGMAIGLDRNDTIIRRRIRQKVEFVAEDLASQIKPTDEELEAYLAAHAEQFRVDPRITFRHVYLDADERGASVEADAHELLIALNGDPTLDASTLGDSLLLEPGYAGVSQRDIGGLFGYRFAEAVVELEPGEWHGPIVSGYGVHLVFVAERRGARLPELDEVRAQVDREWSNARRIEMTDKFYADLVDRYRVEIEWPEADATGDDS